MKLSLASRIVLPAALLLAFAVPSSTKAQPVDQDHIVSSQALDQQVQTSSAERQKNIEVLNNLVATPTAQKAMKDAKIDPQQVKTAIPTLSDKELSDLATRTTNAQHDLAAGYIGPGLFTIIILAIILIIIVIVIH